MLPNITGSFHAGAQNRVATGAFIGEALNMGDPQGDGRRTHNYTFNAALCSRIYGDINTVQPPAIQLIPQIRY